MFGNFMIGNASFKEVTGDHVLEHDVRVEPLCIAMFLGRNSLCTILLGWRTDGDAVRAVAHAGWHRHAQSSWPSTTRLIGRIRKEPPAGFGTTDFRTQR